MYGIAAVRWDQRARNPGHRRIGTVLMGMLARDARRWELEPAPVPVSEVIDRILDGDAVVAVVPAADGTLAHGARAQVRLEQDGPVVEEAIAFPEEAGAPRLDDLPRF